MAEEYPPFGPPAALPPIELVINDLRAKGMPDSEIVKELRKRGYSSQEILSAMQAAGMRPGAPPGLPPGMPAPPAPPRAPARAPPPAPVKEERLTLLTEDIEEIAEAIIAERWKELTKDFEKLEKWREETETLITTLQESMKKLEEKMDDLEKAIFGKVEEYGKGISDVSSELKAMQRVFKTIMPEFTTNIKDLRELLEKAREEEAKPKRRRRKK